MATKPLNRNSQPRPQSPVLLLRLLPGPAQPRCAFSPPHPPLPSRPFREFRASSSGRILTQPRKSPLPPFVPFVPFVPSVLYVLSGSAPRLTPRFLATICGSQENPSKTGKLWSKKRPLTSNTVPKRPEIGRYGPGTYPAWPLFPACLHNIWYLASAYTTASCIHAIHPGHTPSRSSGFATNTRPRVPFPTALKLGTRPVESDTSNTPSSSIVYKKLRQER